jgi:hypothetical protein
VTQDDRSTTGEPGAVSAGDGPTSSGGADDRDRSEARTAEIRTEVATTDARRAEEEVAEQHEEVEAAQEKERELADRERQAREDVERASAEAERARSEAGASAESRPGGLAGLRAAAGPRAAAVAASLRTGEGGQPSALDRPEVLVGGAFAGAFVLARVLKAIFD